MKRRTVGAGPVSAQNGITLIALVVTIIILLILAGVVINLTIGENPLFKKAKTAAENYANAQQKEETEIAEITNEVDNITNNGIIKAEYVTFTPEDSNWTGITNVKEALDYLYNNQNI